MPLPFRSLFKSSGSNTGDETHHYTPARNSSDESEESLSSDGLLEKDTIYSPPKSSALKRWTPLILVHIFIFVLYLFVLYLVTSLYASSERLNGAGLVFSPAREAVLYEERPFTLGDRIQEHSVYSGKPSTELDLAWHNLLNYENIRLSPEVMDHYGREEIGVAIPDGSGYVGTLNVYHELHCIKRLHQYMYEDFYFKNITPKQKEMNRLHNEHCLDFLRQAAMCHGDIGLITFQWAETSRLPVANATSHECVNWQKLDDWTQKNSVDMFKIGLVHPTLGPAYPDGEGDSIGAADGPHHGMDHGDGGH